MFHHCGAAEVRRGEALGDPAPIWLGVCEGGPGPARPGPQTRLAHLDTAVGLP